jgi:hypothetical protein
MFLRRPLFKNERELRYTNNYNSGHFESIKSLATDLEEQQKK